GRHRGTEDVTRQRHRRERLVAGQRESGETGHDDERRSIRLQRGLAARQHENVTALFLHYCFGMPAALITFAYFSISTRTKLANDSGGPPITSRLSAAKRSASSGLRITLSMSVFRRATMSFGVFAGAKRP